MTTPPNTEGNADKELEAKIDAVLKEFAENVLIVLDPSAPGDTMVTNPTAVILQIFKEEQSALLDRIKEVVPQEVKLNDMFGNDPRNNYGYSEELRVEGANYQAKKIHRAIDNIAKEIQGEG